MPKKKKVRPKKPTAKKLEALWGKAIKARAGHTCEYHTPGACHGNLHAHHIGGKRTLRAKTALENGICVCGYAHLRIAHEDGGVGPRAREFKVWAMNKRNVTEEHLNMLNRQCGDFDHFGVEQFLKDSFKAYEEMATIHGKRSSKS